MSRNWPAAYQHIDDRFRANWSATALIGDNELDNPTAPLTLFQIEFTHGEKIATAEIGNHTIEDNGELLIHVMSPLGEGRAFGLSVCQIAADLWNDYSVVSTFGRLRFHSPLPPSCGVSDDGTWWRTSISVPFTLTYFA